MIHFLTQLLICFRLMVSECHLEVMTSQWRRDALLQIDFFQVQDGATNIVSLWPRMISAAKRRFLVSIGGSLIPSQVIGPSSSILSTQTVWPFSRSLHSPSCPSEDIGTPHDFCLYWGLQCGHCHPLSRSPLAGSFSVFSCFKTCYS